MNDEGRPRERPRQLHPPRTIPPSSADAITTAERDRLIERLSAIADGTCDPATFGWAFDLPMPAGVLPGCEGIELGALLVSTVDDLAGVACVLLLLDLAERQRGRLAAAAYTLLQAVTWRDLLDLSIARELELRAIACEHAGESLAA